MRLQSPGRGGADIPNRSRPRKEADKLGTARPNVAKKSGRSVAHRSQDTRDTDRGMGENRGTSGRLFEHLAKRFPTR
jgi:hypothetical protein